MEHWDCGACISHKLITLLCLASLCFEEGFVGELRKQSNSFMSVSSFTSDTIDLPRTL